MRIRKKLKNRERKHGSEVINVKISDLIFLKNPRVHPEREIEGIMESIKKYGFGDPVHLPLRDNTLLEGYARVEAVKRLKRKEVRAIRMDYDPSEYYIAMILGNRLAEMASWNYMELMKVYDEEIGLKNVPPPDLGFSVDEFENMQLWQKEESEFGFEMTDFLADTEKKPQVAPAKQARKMVDITLTMSKELWETIRVELESDLVSMAQKFEGLKYSPPKVRTLKKV